ncbi:GNAT family N-acetyltransferase [Agreia pratensis]|uniref:N-acyl-L-homoserine lactone synthetase n=1 Tax=Agreia pratensis TaxID=150121 RepID=A0A1X7IHT1_9MICO|nr:GNAT family N-acyltransferase [Agreia pratensis]MBF4633214.1 GNAT family N-acetyltransferase [Agreia pratensis]SMG13880.1 hypothetical protein SAMN06296010_0484 [Agreia pratensis]
MSHVDQSVTNEAVIPVVSSTVFDASPSSRLAMGVLAVDGVAVPGLEDEYLAHFRLRKRVYVDQTGQLAEKDLLPDGTDRDADDSRSVTFCVLENHPNGTRVVGVSRLIVRGQARPGDSLHGTPLPVEDFCPDAFDDGPLAWNAVEVSRVIARHKVAVVQESIQWYLFALMLAYVTNHGLGRAFAIIEPWFERHLKSIITIERIGDVRFIEHYLDYNVPIEIDVEASTATVTGRTSGLVERLLAAGRRLVFVGRVPSTATSVA